MIQINHPKIKDFVDEHNYAVKEYYERKATSGFPKSDLDCINNWLNDVTGKDFEYIIKASPKQLEELLRNYTAQQKIPNCVKKITKLYSGFANSTKKFKDKKDKTNKKDKNENDYNAVKLVEKLGITVCPYCNREYIFKFEDTKKQKERVLATFDHFYNKATYPFLALSFYNLIPSCSTCNSKFKTTKNFFKEKHLHPYEDDFNSRAKFYLKIVKPNFYHSTKGIKIELKENDNTDTETINTISTSRLKEIYEKHSDIALELIKKQYMYSDDYLETLYKQYEGTLFKNLEQLKGIIFGNYISDEIHKRPLAKFTKDIIKDLE